MQTSFALDKKSVEFFYSFVQMTNISGIQSLCRQMIMIIFPAMAVMAGLKNKKFKRKNLILLII